MNYIYSILTFLVFITTVPSCSSTEQSNKTTSKEFINNHIKVIRIISEENDSFLVEILIQPQIPLKGYFVIEDKFNSSLKIETDEKCAYEPYFISDEQIRFVFSDPATTIPSSMAIPIPNDSIFSVSYKIKKTTGIKINGAIRYLVNNSPVPELNTSTEIK